MDGHLASELADLAGTTVAEVRRLVDLGILVVRDGACPPLDGIAAAIRAERQLEASRG